MGCLGNMTAVEKLMALAADWEDRSCGLYVHLREGSEGRWGVNGFSRGSVSEILREIADRALEEQADLKMFAERVHGMLWADGWHDLDEIADRLEEELSELDSMRCAGEVYRVNSEDYAAAMWVREHGGVDGLKACMLPDGIEWPRYEDGEPVRLGGSYEKTSGIPGTAMTMQLRMYGDVPTWIIGKGKGKVSVKPGERVKRTATKVLDADGVEILVGDTVYHVEDGSEMTVYGIEGEWLVVSVGGRVHHDIVTHRATVLAADGEPLEVGQTVWDVESGIEYEVVGIHTDEDTPVRVMRTDGSHLAKAAKPSTLTHQRPVLDADGVLCREGDEVWEVGSHRRREIVGTHYRDYETGEPLILCDGDDAIPIPATCVTHAKPEPPDSWERIEDDCAKFCIEYCDEHGLLDHGCNAAEGDASTRHCTDCGDSCEERMARDLVRRARALAERGA